MLNFRLANLSDSFLLSVLFKQVYIDTYGKEGVTHELSSFMEKQFSIEKIEKDISSDKVKMWMATFKGNPVGVLQLEYDKKCPVREFIAPEINKLYILRKFFGKGIGKKMMMIAEDQLKKDKVESVWLWALERNERAVRFYQKMGYENIGTAYFQMEVNNYKNVVLRKKI